MKLYALADLHLSYRPNREALAEWPARPDDWLILAGDVGETLEHLKLGLAAATERFAKVFWVPGNHELWSHQPGSPRGLAKYDAAVAMCRRFGVLTPEDPYVVWPGEPACVIAPLFVLFDYTFRPDDVAPADAVAWAADDGILSADERFLAPDPYPSRTAWCHARVDYSEQRLAAACATTPSILVNHYPLRQDLVRLHRIPRFSPWCGTRRTEHWHTRFRARVVVSGHLHLRATDWIDGVRFEEVSLGYPRHWRREQGIDRYLREILPGPTSGPHSGGPEYHW
ncbi:MAG: metallophosphoesterase [Acidobacteria bacterium]|nr:metallophosphoesterase [Acidobacteriota bacterium]